MSEVWDIRFGIGEYNLGVDYSLAVTDLRLGVSGCGVLGECNDHKHFANLLSYLYVHSKP